MLTSSAGVVSIAFLSDKPIGHGFAEADADLGTELMARVVTFAKGLWPSFSACIFWMSVLSCMAAQAVFSCNTAFITRFEHWAVALTTGVLTGGLAVVLSFTPIDKLHSNRFGHALLVGLLTIFSDAVSHADHYIPQYHLEALVTGALAAVLAFIGTYLAAPLRAIWMGAS
jgi:hypothetical protein